MEFYDLVSKSDMFQHHTGSFHLQCWVFWYFKEKYSFVFVHTLGKDKKKIYLRLQYSGRTPFQDDETITRSQEKASSIADALVLLGKMAPFVICNVSINWTTVKSLPWNGCYTASNLLFKRLSLHLLTLSPCNWKTFILTEKMCQYPCEPCHKPVQSAIWRIHAQVRQQPPVAFYLELCNWTTHNILSSICLAH